MPRTSSGKGMSSGDIEPRSELLWGWEGIEMSAEI